MRFLVTSLLLCSACSQKDSPSEQIDTNTIKEEELPGEYENVGIMAIADLKYTLNENNTFDAEFKSGTPYQKGTYNTNESNTQLILYSKNSISDGVVGNYEKYGDYYFKKEEHFAYFGLDEEYGIPISFDENGHSNQIFSSSHHSIGDSQWYTVTLELKEDGTCIVNKYIRTASGNRKSEERFDGTYLINEGKDILTVRFDEIDHICIIQNDRVYYNVLKKMD